MQSIRNALRGICLLAALVVLISATGSVQNAHAQSSVPGVSYEDPQFVPYRQLISASQTPATITFHAGGFPRSIVGQFPVSGANQVERARDFLNQFSDLFMLDHPDLDLYVRTTIGLTDGGDETVIFEQTYRGVKVEGSQLSITVVGEMVYMVSGNLMTNTMLLGQDVKTRPILSFADARERAREALGETDAPIPFSPELRIFNAALFDRSIESQPTLAWAVMTEEAEVLIDARTGETLSVNERHAHETDFDLDLEHAHGSNAEDTGCYWWTDDNEAVGDEDGVYDGWEDDVDIYTGWQASLFAYNFYYSNFGLDSYDNDDGELEVYLYANFPDNGVGGIDNANWHAGYGCDLIQFRAGKVAFDRMVHEYTHAVIEYREAGTLYQTTMAIAINEGLSYIMAAFSDGNWTMGEDTVDGSGVSWNLANPAANGAPDQWSEYSTANTNHANSMILGHAAALVTDGGVFNGYTLNGIGAAKALRLFYIVMYGITEGSDFVDVRDRAVAAAGFFASPPPFVNAGNPLYGFTQQDVCEVRNAFAAVELGDNDMNCDGVPEPNINDLDQDGVYGVNDNCPDDWNPTQEDADNDGEGSACDPLDGNDPDNDGIPTYCDGVHCTVLADNCPDIYNPDQRDQNFNGVGSACDITEDSDFDDDGVANPADNCPFDPNPDQANVDAQLDENGDACDPDEDSDGFSNDDDNCISDPNPDQLNSDNDPLGDACDICPTGDNNTGVAIGYNDINPYDDDPGEVIYYYDEETYTCSEGFSRPDMQGIPVPVFDAGGVFNADCQPTEVTVTVNPGGYETLPIAVDTAQDMDWFPRGTYLNVTLDGLPEGVHTWIQDSDGRSFGDSHAEGSRHMRVRPLGGQNYAIGMVFRDDMTAGEQITISGSVDLEFGGVTLCPPETSEPVSTPIPTAAPTSTPTAMPTAAPTTVPTSAPSQPPAPTPVDVCGGFRLTSPSGGMFDGPMTFYWDPAPAAQTYRINIIDRDTNALLLQSDHAAPATNVTLDVSYGAIGGGQNLSVNMEVFAAGTVICTSNVPQTRETPPPAPAQCSITMVGEALVYQVPIVDSGNIFDELQPGAQSAVIGRTGDNAWWQLAYNNTWIETSAVNMAATTSGDCGNLPVTG